MLMFITENSPVKTAKIGTLRYIHLPTKLPVQMVPQKLLPLQTEDLGKPGGFTSPSKVKVYTFIVRIPYSKWYESSKGRGILGAIEGKPHGSAGKSGKCGDLWAMIT